nr:TetR/AcrR family transcriptional regulator C-terminal domain-containing protein [Alteraurantiacibacter buctensis]
MVRHARAQIMAVGVDRFSVNEVLRASGGSKATLAKYFGDRSGLIAAAIGAEAQAAVADLALDEVAGLPLGEALERVLAGILRFYLLPGSLALYRAVVSAADPVGSAGFYRQGHQSLVAALAALLEARKGAEVRSAVDSSAVADQMLHAIRAGLYEQALIGLGESAVSAQDAALRARATVALFLPSISIDGLPAR